MCHSMQRDNLLSDHDRPELGLHLWRKIFDLQPWLSKKRSSRISDRLQVAGKISIPKYACWIFWQNMSWSMELYGRSIYKLFGPNTMLCVHACLRQGRQGYRTEEEQTLRRSWINQWKRTRFYSSKIRKTSQVLAQCYLLCTPKRLQYP